MGKEVERLIGLIARLRGPGGCPWDKEQTHTSIQECLLEETYEIPAGFDPYAILEHAWGIWFKQGRPVTVRLRFSARVAERVKETRWHRSQEIESLSDGSLLWTVLVDEPIEMTPWIRGWGPEVEVIEPEELRQKFVQETAELVTLYGSARDISVNPSEK